MQVFEEHETAKPGEPVTHAIFKEMVAGFAVEEVDKLVEMHGLKDKGINVDQLKKDALEQAEA
ncbi:hypothetical protein HDU99_007523, partial [Rhizoclosmatium hyalinum]